MLKRRYLSNSDAFDSSAKDVALHYKNTLHEVTQCVVHWVIKSIKYSNL